MTRVFLDATISISLGSIGELDLLRNFSGQLVVLPAVQSEVDTETARRDLQRFLETHDIRDGGQRSEDQIPRALSLLENSERNGYVEIIPAVHSLRGDERPDGAISDDREIRTAVNAFGTTMTGVIGVVNRAVENGLPESAGLDILERIDSRGLHMTGEFREQAESLIQVAFNDTFSKSDTPTNLTTAI